MGASGGRRFDLCRGGSHMTHRRVLQWFAAAFTLAALALPAAAGAHPEECASTNALSGAPSAEWFADWTAENDGCLSAAAVRGFDDSDAQLTAAGATDGTPNLTLTSNTPKPVAVRARRPHFNSDLAFENGYAYGGNYDGVQIWDVRGETPRLASSHPLPGLAERRHGQRRDPRHVDRLAPHRRHVRRAAATSTSERPHHLGGPEDLRRPQPGGTEVRQVRAHRLRLAHPHGDPAAQPPARLRAVV